MNEIEQIFYNAFIEEYVNPDNGLCFTQDIETQVVIGIYKVDFLINKKYVIEIDGHEFHKTKEQRENDYTRDRYLLRHGYVPIRFTATEIYLSTHASVVEAMKLVNNLILAQEQEAFERYKKNIKESGGS